MFQSLEMTSNSKHRTDKNHKKHETRFPKEYVENTDFYKPLLNKIMITRE